MDIIGPLPCSHSGKWYVLVICDYVTRCPEAIPLHSIDASHIAEELIAVFERVRIPSAILKSLEEKDKEVRIVVIEFRCVCLYLICETL